MKDSILIPALKEMGISTDNEKIGKVLRYLDLLTDFNRSVNLVGTKDKKDILVRHIIDSLSIFRYQKGEIFNTGKKYRILDLGTGGGLPGIPISIFMPESRICLMEKRTKKASFLNHVKESMSLENISVINENAEVAGHDDKYRENFDVVLSRAFGRIDVLYELSMPFVKVGSIAVYYKSRKLYQELDALREIIPALGGKSVKIIEADIPFLNEFRAFLLIRKFSKTMKDYPRKYAIIKRNSLFDKSV